MSCTVTMKRSGKEALEMLRKSRDSFDIVITDVVRSDMDGFKLLEIIGLEMDIPVISKLPGKKKVSGIFLFSSEISDNLSDIYDH